MNRRNFIKAGLVGAVGLTVPLKGIELLLNEYKEVDLPFLDGIQTVRIPVRSFSLVPEAHATNFGGYDYRAMAQYEHMRRIEQARIYWEQRMRAMMAQRYRWMQERHWEEINRQMGNYAGYNIGEPNVWGSIRSIYGFAEREHYKPVLFGVNRKKRPVAISKTLKGSAAVFEKVGEFFDRDEQEKTVGPQSNEVQAKILLPSGDTLTGNGYKTKNGALALSNNVVQTADGSVGQLAKYKLSDDGNQYLIV